MIYIFTLVGLVISFYFLSKGRSKLSIIISFVLAASFILNLIIPLLLAESFPAILFLDLEAGYNVFGVGVILSLVYPFLSKKNLGTKSFFLYYSFTILIFLSFLLRKFHLSGANILSLLMIIPIGIYIYMLSKRKKFKYELSFLTLLVMEALMLSFLYWKGVLVTLI